MSERCELCGARWKKGHLKCHDCGAPKRTTLLPKEPAGAPIDAAASLATEPTPHIEAFADESTSSAPVAAVAASASTSAAAASVSAAAPAASASTSAAAASVSAAVPAASASTSVAVTPPAAGPALAAPSAAAPRAVPGAPSAPLPRPGGGRGPWPLLVGVAVLAIGGGIAFFVLRSEPARQPAPEQAPISISARGLAPPGCADLEALAGSWVFTTATTNARKDARIGMRGFFELQIEVTDCTAEATVTKVGRKGKPTFSEHKQPRASASLSASEEGLYSFGFGARFDLENEDGQGVPLRITFAREGENLVGAWRQVGERWETSGMYGVLVGQRDGDPRKIRVRRKEQPCAIQCAAPEDIAEVEQPSPAAVEACRSTCG